MKSILKSKVAFTIVILIGAFVLVEMGLYLIHQVWKIDFGWDLFQYCVTTLKEQSKKHSVLEIVFDGIILYTVIRIVWRISKQIYLTWKSSALFESKKNDLLTERLNQRYRNWKTAIIVIQDDSFVALAMGLFKRKIIVSTGLLEMFSDLEVEAILIHEWHHCRNHDPLKVFLVTLVIESMGYVPILKGIVHYYKVWIELLADRFVMYQMGSAYELGNVLLKLTKKGAIQSPKIGVPFADVAINYRIQQIIDPNKSMMIPFFQLKPTLLSIGIILFLFSFVLGGCV